MNVCLLAIISSVVVASMCQECPNIYLRYSQQPTYCKPRNPQCKILKYGVNSAEIQQILDTHNNYRNTLANGNEKQAGGLPPAADMMQMVWDKELAAVAQKLAESCVFDHDANDARRVENFGVGQNLGTATYNCNGNQNCIQQIKAEWPATIKGFYDEIPRFNKDLVPSVDFQTSEEETYGHFTQVVWSSSWRIGCGFVQYEEGDAIKHLYACNYGPAGNTLNGPLYKIGTPCSACPTNSCCGKTCPNSDYNALCRMNSNSEAPAYPIEDAYIYYNDLSKSDDWSVTSDGGTWKYVPALGGPYVEGVLNPGEENTLTLTRPLTYQQSQTCLQIVYRKGATVMGQNVNNKAVLSLVRSSGGSTDINLPPTYGLAFMPFGISLPFSGTHNILCKFSVPSGADPQYINIQLVSAKNGNC